MVKGYVTKETLSVITSLIISAGAVVATVFMMFIIFIATILLIGIVLG